MKLAGIMALPRSTLRGLALWTVLAVFAPLVAHAQTTSGTAKDLYESGTAHYNLGEWKEARRDFKAAYLKHRDPVFLFNIAQCDRQLNDPQSAALEYRAYLREAPDAPNRDEAKRLEAEMEKAVRDQRATQPPTGTEPPGATQPRPAAGVSPSETVAPPPTAAPVTPTPVKASAAGGDHQRGRAMRLAGIGLIAGGGAMLALGGAFVGLANSANNRAGANGVYDPSAEDSRDTYQTLDVTFFVAGGLVAVTGVVLYVLGRRVPHRFTASSATDSAAQSFDF